MGWWWLDITKLILIITEFKVVVEVGFEKVLKINFHRWEAGSSGNKAISAFNLVEVEAELGNKS